MERTIMVTQLIYLKKDLVEKGLLNIIILKIIQKF